MALFKQKIGKNGLVVMVNWLILAVFSLEVLNPLIVLAQSDDAVATDTNRGIMANFTGFLASISQKVGINDEEQPTLPKSNPRAPDKLVDAVITAYSSTVDQCDDDPFIAASGKHVYDGMIAANWLPLGTKIKIPALYGDKIFTVDDRMNARYGYGRMDIWMDAPRAEVKKFGVKRVQVEVYYQPRAVAKRVKPVVKDVEVAME